MYYDMVVFKFELNVGLKMSQENIKIIENVLQSLEDQHSQTDFDKFLISHTIRLFI